MNGMLQRTASVTLVLSVVMMLSACESSSDEPVEVVDDTPVIETITGTLTYEMDIILAPESITRVELIDVTAADAEPVMIAETFIHGFDTPPLPFTLEYNAREIEAGHRYEIRADVMEQTRLMFKSTDSYPVLNGEGVGPVHITLKHVPGGKVERMAENVRANNPMISGFYYYFDGKGEFIDCETAEVHPVAKEGGVFGLQSIYRKEAKEYGDQVFTRVSGNYVTRPAREGGGKEKYLVVKQVEEMDATGDCP